MVRRPFALKRMSDCAHVLCCGRFFGAIYYWGIWAFVIVFLIVAVFVTCRRRKSMAQRIVNDLRTDFDDSDDDDLQDFEWSSRP